MRINISNWLLLTLIFLPTYVCGQDIRARYDSGRSTGRQLFSALSSTETGYSIETDGIFSSLRIGEDAGFKHIIASISIDRYIYKKDSDSYKDYDFFNDIWLCLDDNLIIRFYYPVGTLRAFTFSDGISLFSFHNVEGMLGAVNSEGAVVMRPVYNYIAKNDLHLNGICDIVRGSDVTFKCEVYEFGSLTPEYYFNVIFEDVIDRDSTVHDRFYNMVNPDAFQKMLDNIQLENDSRMYLWGIHEMLNMNYEKALNMFRQINDTKLFTSLHVNIDQCEKLCKRDVN